MTANREQLLKAAEDLLRESTYHSFLQYAPTQTDDELEISLYQALHQDGQHDLNTLLASYGL